MAKIAEQSLQSNGWTDRADELFQQHRQEIYRNTDQLFARLMLFQWVAAIMIAMTISPRTWVGQSSYIHIHIWAGFLPVVFLPRQIDMSIFRWQAHGGGFVEGVFWRAARVALAVSLGSGVYL